MTSKKIFVENLKEGERLDKALAAHPEIPSRSRAAELIEQGRVEWADSEPNTALKASYKVQSTDRFYVHLPTPQPSQLEPLEMDLEILFEDSDILVVNKPAGLVVHPAAGHWSDTLVNALIHQVKDLSMGFAEQRPGIVHRLDKDTSGVLVVAKNDRAQDSLVSQFKSRSIHRLYYALVVGEPRPSSGRRESLLTRHPTQRKKFCSGSSGKLAITHYKTLKVSPQGVSLIQCQLETGRTHQIRIHLSEMGHPILGDSLYGGVQRAKSLKSKQLRQDLADFNRLALHAAELGLTHPKTGQRLHFSSPWPSEVQNLLTSLGLP